MFSQQRIIDLSMTIHEGMQTFCVHWHPLVEITQMGRHGIEDRETRKLVLGTHTGTHVDAPRHFVPHGETIDNIPLDVFIGRAAVLDFSWAADCQELHPRDLEVAIGSRCMERLIFRFDWDVRALGTKRYYTDHPFLSEDSCRWLVKHGCRLIALDTPQPDNPTNGYNTNNDAPNHRILLSQNTIIVEYLVNIREITQPEVELVVAPIKIKDGDGAPARCFVIERG